MNDDIAASSKVGILVADERHVWQIEASRVSRAVDKAKKVTRIEITKSCDFVDDSHAGAKTIEENTFKFKAQIGTLRSDMEEQVARRRRRCMNCSLNRRKCFQFLRPAVGT